MESTAIAKRKDILPQAEIKPEKRPYVRKWGEMFNRTWDDDSIEVLADEMLDWFADENKWWLKDFFISKMLPWEYASRFANRNEYFAWALGLCKLTQESRLATKSFDKSNNPGMGIFALKNTAGWRDEPPDDGSDADREQIASKFAAMVQTAGTGHAASGDKPLPE